MGLKGFLVGWRTPSECVEVSWIPGVDGPHTYIRDPKTRQGATMNREGPIGVEMLPPIGEQPSACSIRDFRMALTRARTVATKRGVPVVVSGGIFNETLWSRGKRAWKMFAPLRVRQSSS